MFYYSKASIEKMKFLHPRLVLFLGELIQVSPYDFKITWGVRTAKEQNDLYQQGRTKPGKVVTNLDGYNKKSNHQPKADNLGYAADIAIIINRNVTWEERYYKEAGEKARELMKKYNVTWGGDWKNFKDYPHFELK